MVENDEFTAERARAALNSVLEAIEIPENAVKLGEAKDNAGNDMVKMMQYVFPIVMQIQMDVIKKFGFSEGHEVSENQEVILQGRINVTRSDMCDALHVDNASFDAFDGIVSFSQQIRQLEKEDSEVAHLHAQVRAHFLPPVSINAESTS